jgi:hypothetical protein
LSHKKNYVPQFLKQRDINSYYVLSRKLIEGVKLIGLEDSPLLVLWYKNIFGTPIYSVDFRNGMEAASHWKDDKEE